MGKMLTEVYRIFKKAPLHISIILLMDMTGAILLAFNPYVIGVCIDDLLERKYCWLCIFIALQLILIALYTADKFLDTRIYNKIVEEESAAYYERIIQTDADGSKISSLLDLVDDIPHFLEVDLFNFLSMAGGIIFSLIFIFVASGLLVFMLAISVSIIVPLATYRFQKDIALNNKDRKSIDESRVNIIASRKIERYRNHIRKVLLLDITNSDLDAKIYLITELFQTILLVIAIFSTIYVGNYTSGQLFSIITYVMMLNGYVGEINETIIVVKDLQDTVLRLESNVK